MNQALAKAQIEANIRSRFGTVFNIGEKASAEFLSSGIPEIDALTGGGLLRGAITEVIGTSSSGRMSVLLTALSNATRNGETAGIIDTADSFDPVSAVNSGVNLKRLLWVRCGTNLERAFKATDLLLQSGGFGFIALNLAEVTVNNARRIISSWWFRFRRAMENTPTAFVVISPVSCVRSCASMIFEMQTTAASWTKTPSPREIEMNLLTMTVNQIPLSKNPPDGHSSVPNYARLLTAIEAEVKLAKPTTWTTTFVQFTQPVRSHLDSIRKYSLIFV